MYLLDTNICISVLKHHSKSLRHRFSVTPDLSVSSITLAELYFGIENSPASLRGPRREQLEIFISLLRVRAFDSDAAGHYGNIRAVLRRQGRLIGNNDLLIAAHARSLGAVVVTNNEREFGRVPDLIVENWV